MEEKNLRRDKDQEEIFEKVVRAGKRTYFFDVRATKNRDYYLTITESKKKFGDNGSAVYQKHKLFLYKEDFEKFAEAFSETVNKVIELNNETNESIEESVSGHYSDIKFEDLDGQ